MTAFRLGHVAVRNLTRRPFRTGVLLFSTALLTCAVLFVLSFGKRLDTKITNVYDRLGGDLIIVPAGARGAAEEFLLENRLKTFYMDARVLEKVKSYPEVARLTHQTYLTTIPGACCGVFDAQVIAFEPRTDFIVKPWLERVIRRDLGRGEVILGSAVQEFLDELRVEEAFLFGKSFQIAGVLEKSGTSLDQAIFIREDDLYDLVREDRVPGDVRENRVSIAFVQLKRGYDAEEVSRRMEAELLEVDVIPRGRLGGVVYAALVDVRRILLFLVVVAATLSVLLSWAVFAVIAGERKRETGVLRALGATAREALQLFLLEAGLTGILGSLIGMLVGAYLHVALPRRFALLADSPPLGVPATLLVVAASFAAGVATCLLGALLPARAIVKGEPLASLRDA